MKRKNVKRLLGLVTAIALAMSLCLLGCGGSGGSNGSRDKAAAPSAGSAAPAPEPSSGMQYWSSGTAPEEDVSMESNGGADASAEMPQFQMPDSRKIIRHLSMDLETREFTEAVQSIQAAVAEAGGYIESQNQEG